MIHPQSTFFIQAFFNSGQIDKKNPIITKKILTYLKNNPDAFHPKFKHLELKEFRKFILFLSEDCGAWKYKNRGMANSTIAELSKTYGNIKKWYFFFINIFFLINKKIKVKITCGNITWKI